MIVKREWQDDRFEIKKLRNRYLSIIYIKHAEGLTLPGSFKASSFSAVKKV